MHCKTATLRKNIYETYQHEYMSKTASWQRHTQTQSYVCFMIPTAASFCLRRLFIVSSFNNLPYVTGDNHNFVRGHAESIPNFWLELNVWVVYLLYQIIIRLAVLPLDKLFRGLNKNGVVPDTRCSGYESAVSRFLASYVVNN